MRKIIFFMLCLLSLPAQAEIYKCAAANGKIAYQEKPCNLTGERSITTLQPENQADEGILNDIPPAQGNDSDASEVRHGRNKRAASAKAVFRQANPCPVTDKYSGPCPGYVIDYIEPLVCGGADDPGNMQWQTVDAAREQKRQARYDCGDARRGRLAREHGIRIRPQRLHNR
ncbi:MAG: DUF4124 domain-containing protein [Gammaproteobacteria bacterium]